VYLLLGERIDAGITKFSSRIAKTESRVKSAITGLVTGDTTGDSSVDDSKTAANRKLVMDSASGTNEKLSTMIKLLGAFGPSTDAMLHSLSQPTIEPAGQRGLRSNRSSASSSSLFGAVSEPADIASVLEAILSKLCSLDKRVSEIEGGVAGK
jgi:hypothetical protein